MAIVEQTLAANREEQRRYGAWLRLWNEVQEAFDYIQTGKALTVGGEGWHVERIGPNETRVTIVTVPGSR